MSKAATAVVVDDMKLARLKLKQICEKLGFENVIQAQNGKEGWQAILASESVPAIVLTDYNMPDMNGLEFLELIRNHGSTQKVPVVFITSESESSLLLKAYSSGVTDYVVKPYDEASLSKKIQEILADNSAS